MYLFFVALHILLCILLVLIILLQPGKGGDIGAAFGGGGSTMFGPRGPTSLLQRGTTAVAVLFMVTSITLALYSNQRLLNNSNIDELLDGEEQEVDLLGGEDAPAEDPDEASADPKPGELPPVE